jgi:hypothetical protein
LGTISLTSPIAGTVITAGLHATNYVTIQSVINGSLDANNWGAGKIFAPSKITQEGATTNQTLVWNGTIWVPTNITAIPGAVSVYDRVTTAVDVQNSSSETSVYTKTITGNDMSTNRTLRCRIAGDYLHNNVPGDTIRVKIKFGGTIIWDSGANPMLSTTSANRHPWFFYFELTNLGATNSQWLDGFIQTQIGSGAVPTVGLGSWPIGDASELSPISTNGPATIDTTTNQTLDVTVQWSAVSVNDSWRMRKALLELV